MKWNFLQGDFSSGELSKRAQGQIGSDIYKAGLSRAANAFPTRSGSMASRAGGRLITDGSPSAGVGTNQGPVQHIPIHDAPLADFIVEMSATEIRLMDKFGIIPWIDIPNQFMQYTYQSAQAWADANTRTVHLYHTGVGTSSYLLVNPSPGAGSNPAAYPFGTTEVWTLSGFMAGTDVTLRITEIPSNTVQNFNLSTNAGQGAILQAFTPNQSGAPSAFKVELITTGAADAATLWGLHLVKNGNPTVITYASAGLVVSPLGTDRIRAAATWVNMNLQVGVADLLNYWVVFAGGPRNAFAGWSLRWQPSAGFTPSQWSFQFLPCAPGSVAAIQGSNSVAVYQERIWFGRNQSGNRPQLVASATGFVDLFDNQLTGGVAGTHVVNFVFSVVSETYVVTGANVADHEAWNAGTSAGAADVVRFNIPGVLPPYPTSVPSPRGPAPRLSVYRNGVLAVGVAGPLGAVAIPAQQYVGETPEGFFASQDVVGGVTYWPHGAALVAGDVLKFTTLPEATDPLALNPTNSAKTAWLHVLRGLMLGSTRSEKLFPQGDVLALDPATGSSPTLNDESNIGADEQLNAITVNDKIVFVQKGRQIVRMANVSFFTGGALVAEDIGVLGEDLTAPRIRAMCYLKTPVSRIVLAMDDGTGAVGTLVGKTIAWSRFTIPAVFGGIYSVAALDGPLGSELWVGTDNGVTLQWDSFESDVSKFTLTTPAVFPAAPTRTPYDYINPLPPVMDGWVRCGLANVAGVQFAEWLSRVCDGQQVYVFVNGQIQGPLPAVANMANNGAFVVLPAALNLTNTWLDPNGVTQPQEVYVGLAYPEHRFTTLPIEGGNPVGTSQNLTSRKPQLYVRFVDSYLPKVNGERPAERSPGDPNDELAGRVTGDRRATEMNWQRASVVDIVMDLPLRMEISAIFGGGITNNI